MHIDCDIYSSTALIFSSLLEYSDQLMPIDSCLILFLNELIGYPTYEDHEIKAFYEFYQLLIQKYSSCCHVVIELLPRPIFGTDQAVGFRICLFPREEGLVARGYYSAKK